MEPPPPRSTRPSTLVPATTSGRAALPALSGAGRLSPGGMNNEARRRDMLSRIMGALSAEMAIDLGTANTLVYVKGRDIVPNEPSVVAIAESKGKKRVLAAGNEATQILDRTLRIIQAIRPLRDGVVAVFEDAEAMIKEYNGQGPTRRGFQSPQIVV